MIITISGTPGSGKSTIAKILEKKLKYKRLYIGAIQRKIAKDKGITLEELNKLEEKDSKIDNQVDNEIKKAAKEHDNLIIESRTAAGLFKKWNIKKPTLHIFIKCKIKTGAKRIFKQKQEQGHEKRNENMPQNLKKQIKELKTRIKSEKKRFKKYYGFNAHKKKLYNLNLDSTNKTPEEIVNQVLKNLKL